MKAKEVYSEKQYDSFASEFKFAQEGFYGSKNNESRKILYSLLGTSLKGNKLLDVGCGFGKDTEYYKRLGAEVFGIDVSKKMIGLAEDSSKNVKFSAQNYAKTKFDSNYFDILVSRYALQYAPNLERVFKEMHRILKPGGLFIFLVSHPLLGYVAKKEKNYHKREIVDMPIFKGKITAKEPTHTLSEYLSDFVLKNFN